MPPLFQKSSRLVDGLSGLKSGVLCVRWPDVSGSLAGRDPSATAGPSPAEGVATPAACEGDSSVAEGVAVAPAAEDIEPTSVLIESLCVRTRNLLFDNDTLILPGSREGPGSLEGLPLRDTSFSSNTNLSVRCDSLSVDEADVVGRSVSLDSSSRKVVFLVLKILTSEDWSLSESELEERKSRRQVELKRRTRGRAPRGRAPSLSSECAREAARRGMPRSTLASVDSDMFVIRFSSRVPESRRMSRIKSRLSLIVCASTGAVTGLICVDEFVIAGLCDDVPEVDG